MTSLQDHPKSKHLVNSRSTPSKAFLLKLYLLLSKWSKSVKKDIRENLEVQIRERSHNDIITLLLVPIIALFQCLETSSLLQIDSTKYVAPQLLTLKISACYPSAPGFCYFLLAAVLL